LCLKVLIYFFDLKEKIEKRDWKERKRIEAPNFSCLARKEIEKRKKRIGGSHTFLFSLHFSHSYLSLLSLISTYI
jgi:hypothetical protein